MQNASVLDILNGTDVLVKAKTGTGKTLGFLIPAIDLLIHEKIRVSQVQRAAAREGTYVRTYILCTTMYCIEPQCSTNCFYIHMDVCM